MKGAELRAYRRSRGMTQVEMARMVGVSRSWYQRWEAFAPPEDIEARLGLLPARHPRTKQLPLFTTRP